MYQKIVLFFVVGCFIYINVNAADPPCGTNNNCRLRCQNETDGVALPTATVCEDTRTDCSLLFNCTLDDCEDPTAPTTVPDLTTDPQTLPRIRAPGCDSVTTQDLAMQCAKTCLICCETPEYNCKNDDTGVVDCDANLNKCKDSNWTNIMAQYCPATCGLCLQGSCSDKNAGCDGMKSLCRDIEFHEYMKENCARTCQTCSTSNSTSPSPGSESCVDNANNCAQNKDLCSNTAYYDLMQAQCGCTCKGASNGSGNSCTDANSSCGNWVTNGFCNSQFYTPDQKRQYCAKSCNLC